MQRLLKLRKMSFDEIRTRSLERIRVQWERRLHARNQKSPQRHQASTSASSETLLRQAARLVPGTSRRELDSCQSSDPELWAAFEKRSVDTARRVLSGAWPLLGFDMDLRGDIDWHADPRTEHKWRRQFYADLKLFDIRDDIDVKYVWELGRQQYVADLAFGWLFAREATFAASARDLMLSWIEANPIYEGVHWTSALEHGARAIAWIWALAALQDWNGWNPDDLDQIATSLAEHATFIEHHLSYYSSPYNHLIGEAAGLYLIGCVLRDHGRAEGWRTLGRNILNEHGPRQFYADGFCVEQATGYHYFTLGFLSLAIAAGRTESDQFVELEASVQQAFQAGTAFRQPDGLWPAIGDVDSARAMPLCPDAFWDFASLSNLGAGLFDDGALKLTHDHPGPELYWLQGNAGIARWRALSPAADDREVVLPDAGYAIASRKNDWVLFDAGPIADGLHADATPSTAHGHADMFQVLLALDGTTILHDPGMPFYFGSLDWVQHFRGPSAHNSVDIEGAPVTRTAGRLAWSHVADPPTLRTNLSQEFWLMHGSANWQHDVSFDRYLLGIPEVGVWVIDRIRANDQQSRRVIWNWQLPTTHSSLGVDENRECWTLSAETFQFQSGSRHSTSTCEIQHAQPESPTAWNAVGYGVHQPATRLIQCSEITGLFVNVTFFGRQLVPYEMIMGGKSIVANTGSLREAALFNNIEVPHPSAALQCRLETPDGLVEIAIGTSDADTSQLTGLGWKQLDGRGDLPAWIRATDPSVGPAAACSVTAGSED